METILNVIRLPAFIRAPDRYTRTALYLRPIRNSPTKFNLQILDSAPSDIASIRRLFLAPSLKRKLIAYRISKNAHFLAKDICNFFSRPTMSPYILCKLEETLQYAILKGTIPNEEFLLRAKEKFRTSGQYLRRQVSFKIIGKITFWSAPSDHKSGDIFRIRYFKYDTFKNWSGYPQPPKVGISKPNW